MLIEINFTDTLVRSENSAGFELPKELNTIMVNLNEILYITKLENYATIKFKNQNLTIWTTLESYDVIKSIQIPRVYFPKSSGGL